MTIASQPQLTLDEFLKLPEIELELTAEQVFAWLSL
jgi:hypothetical protein